MECTRNATKCPLFGEICDIKDNILPTYEDIMKYYEWIRRHLKCNYNSQKEPSFQEIAGIVTERIEGIWTKASIPIVSHKRVNDMLKAYHLKCKKLLKSNPKIPKKNLEEFRRSSKALFEISACKCMDLLNCICPKDKKVPKDERSFLLDQRSVRKMFIGNIDVIATKQVRKTLKRKLLRQKYDLKCQKTSQVDVNYPVSVRLVASSSTYSEKNDSVDKELTLKKSKDPQAPVTSMNYSMLAKTCDRYSVSDRAGAAIASAVLQATSSTVSIIDKNKLRRERSKTRQNITDKDRVLEVPALFFDGRKDKTIVTVKKAGKSYRQIIMEEHISLIKEPDSKYLSYIAPRSGSAKVITKAITHYFLTENISTEPLLAIGCDGTNVNVGKYGGIIRLLEKTLNKPLQWIICLLHMNELPFRHLFAYIDGATSGPETLKGPIGKLLENCESKPVVQFQPIPSKLPDLTAQDLSSDQSYIYSIVSAVTTGKFPDDLAHRSPGKMSHARWLTRANRVLRLYVSTKDPSEKLQILATYIVKVYAPTWFAIKIHPSCKDGAKHLWSLISASRYLSVDLKAITDPVIRRNSYFAHPENLLLAMLSDSQNQIRELAARRILKARITKQTNVRLFQVPDLNLDATSYIDLIDWQQNITEPPILKGVSDEELQLFVAQKGNNELSLLRLPCHTQAVERAVKTVTEASRTLCSKISREGFIKAQIESRKDMPKFESKKDFCVK